LAVPFGKCPNFDQRIVVDDPANRNRRLFSTFNCQGDNVTGRARPF
jgi:hypothetical protein